VLLERVQPLVPESPIDSDPIVDVPESLGLEPIKSLPANLFHDDKADLTEYPQMLRNRRDRYGKIAS
jgi:hypothetical protein